MKVLSSAARLQELVQDAVLVGGSAAALYADHRDSCAHDHELAGLSDRFDAVLDAVESQDGWVTNRVTPGKIILGSSAGSAMSLRFRNIDVSPDDPIEIWPTEAVLTALERGGLGH